MVFEVSVRGRPSGWRGYFAQCQPPFENGNSIGARAIAKCITIGKMSFIDVRFSLLLASVFIALEK